MFCELTEQQCICADPQYDLLMDDFKALAVGAVFSQTHSANTTSVAFAGDNKCDRVVSLIYVNSKSGGRKWLVFRNTIPQGGSIVFPVTIPQSYKNDGYFVSMVESGES